jgi:hypothetical protein
MSSDRMIVCQTKPAKFMAALCACQCQYCGDLKSSVANRGRSIDVDVRTSHMIAARSLLDSDTAFLVGARLRALVDECL